MKRSLVLSVALAAVLVVGSSLFAQTGPIGGGTNPPAPAPTPNTNQMLPDRLTDTLRKMGHQAEVRKSAKGDVIVVANIQQNGWRYQVDFEYTVDQRTINVVCPLGVSAGRFTAAQLVNILKKSYEINPVHFSIRGSDQMLLLEDPLYGTINMTETNVQNILNNLMKRVRDTHVLWGVS